VARNITVLKILFIIWYFILLKRVEEWMMKWVWRTEVLPLSLEVRGVSGCPPSQRTSTETGSPSRRSSASRHGRRSRSRQSLGTLRNRYGLRSIRWLSVNTTLCKCDRRNLRNILFQISFEKFSIFFFSLILALPPKVYSTTGTFWVVNLILIENHHLEW